MSKTIQIATTSRRDVERLVTDLGGRVSDVHSTPGACGYTTLTVTTAEEIAADPKAVTVGTEN